LPLHNSILLEKRGSYFAVNILKSIQYDFSHAAAKVVRRRILLNF
jgi:hypothetical protein